MQVQSGAVVRVKEATETAISFVCLPDPRFKGPLQVRPLSEFLQEFSWIDPEAPRDALPAYPTGTDLTDEEIALQTQRIRKGSLMPVYRGQVWEERGMTTPIKYAVLKGSPDLLSQTGDGRICVVVLDKGGSSDRQNGDILSFHKNAFVQTCRMVGRVPSEDALPDVPAYDEEEKSLFYIDSQGAYLNRNHGVTIEIGQVWRSTGDMTAISGEDAGKTFDKYPNYKVVAFDGVSVTVEAQGEWLDERKPIPPFSVQDFRTHFYYLGESDGQVPIHQQTPWEQVRAFAVDKGL